MERRLKSPQRGKSFRHLLAEKEKNRHIKVPKMSILNGVFHLFVVAFCYVLVHSLISYMRHPVLHQFCGGFWQFLQSFCPLMIIAHLCMVHLVSLQSLCSCCNYAVQETLGQCLLVWVRNSSWSTTVYVTTSAVSSHQDSSLLLLSCYLFLECAASEYKSENITQSLSD